VSYSDSRKQRRSGTDEIEFVVRGPLPPPLTEEELRQIAASPTPKKVAFGRTSRCHVCERERDEWACKEDVRVAIRNRLIVSACWRCWFLWPDKHKVTWPALGFGREPQEPLPAGTEIRLVPKLGGGLWMVPVKGRRVA
jgi:hypothetical protein